jgi:hypothetical protein
VLEKSPKGFTQGLQFSAFLKNWRGLLKVKSWQKGKIIPAEKREKFSATLGYIHREAPAKFGG